MSHTNTRFLLESVHTTAVRGEVCARTVQRAIASGALPAFKVGRSVRIRRAECLADIRIGATDPGSELRQAQRGRRHAESDPTRHSKPCRLK